MKLRLKKIFKFCFIFILFIAILFIAYSLFIIYSAEKISEKIMQDYFKSDKIKITVNDLSERQKSILLKVQDPNFYNHKGVDFSTPGNGLTTLTQSITKFLYFDKFKPGFRKIKQSLIARFVINKYATKDQQITIFLNVIWFDKNINGFYDASKYFYDKKISELSEEEFISLVAMIIQPKTFNIKTQPEANKNRVERIKLLVSGKYRPKSLMDLYYGGNTYRQNQNKFLNYLNKIIWGY